jgi:hypothetical protein
MAGVKKQECVEPGEKSMGMVYIVVALVVIIFGLLTLLGFKSSER